MKIQDELLLLRDEKYRQFLIPLIPNIEPETIIGVRTPALRKLAEKIPDKEAFKRELPHRYFEENQLHCFLLEQQRDFDAVLLDMDAFLPYVDNWATCDQLRPKVFARHKRELLPHICRWLKSDHTYTIRFAMEMLMVHYLDQDFSPEYPALVAGVHTEDYYVKMMAAWYFATALAKQYDAVLPYISECRLEKWTHNRAIQKALESLRIPQEKKDLLRTYRWK